MSYLRNLKQLRETMVSQATKASAPEESPDSLIAARYTDAAVDNRSTEDLVSQSASWLSDIKNSAAQSQANAPRKGGNLATGLVKALATGVRAYNNRGEEDAAAEARKSAFIEKRSTERPSTYAPDKNTVLKGDTTPLPENAPIKNVLNAIAAVESKGSGDYKAVGPVVKKGMYAGQRAYGRYQVMEGNIPSWTKAALGREMSTQEFISDENAQDKVAAYQLQKSKDKHGSWEDAASVWFSGKPVKKAGNVTDGFTSVPQYISKFQRAFKG